MCPVASVPGIVDPASAARAQHMTFSSEMSTDEVDSSHPSSLRRNSFQVALGRLLWSLTE